MVYVTWFTRHGVYHVVYTTVRGVGRPQGEKKDATRGETRTTFSIFHRQDQPPLPNQPISWQALHARSAIRDDNIINPRRTQT